MDKRKERLPEKAGERVLVFGDPTGRPYINIAEWGNNEWDIDRDDKLCGFYGNMVTHRMPLPNPPGEKETPDKALMNALDPEYKRVPPRNEAMFTALQQSEERLKDMPVSGSTEETLKMIRRARAREM